MNDGERDLLKHFDSLFDTNTVEHIDINMPLLKNILYMLCEIPTKPNQKYKQQLSKKIEVLDRLMSTFTENQMELFEEYNDLSEQTRLLTEEQLFCFGYIFSKELDREGKINKE